MLVHVSEGFAGEVDRVDDTVIVTRFGYVNFMPFAPERTYVRYARSDGSPVVVEIPMVTRSVIAGYLPSWSLLFGFFVAIAGGVIGASIGGAVAALASVAAGIGVAYAMRRLATRIGRLPADEQDRRRVYGAWIGPATDPVLCGTNLDPWIACLRGLVDARVRASAETRGYRSAPATLEAWLDAALASDDVALLGAAFTLARAETTWAADSAERADLERRHAALWERISARVAEAAAVRGTAELAAATPIPRDRAKAPPAAPISPRLKAIGAAVGSAVLAAGAYLVTHPVFYAVNVSSHDRVVVLVDGKPIAPPIEAQSFARVQLAIGDHTLEAQDASTGQILDRARLHLGIRDGGGLYAPARRKGACMFVQRAVYKEPIWSFLISDRSGLLDPGASAWALPAALDDVLEEPPRSLYVSGDSLGAIRWAAFVVPCPRP